MPGDQGVAPFRGAGEGGRALVPIEQPLRPRVVGDRAEDGLSAAIDAAIGLNQLNGRLELSARHFGKARRHAGILERETIKVIAGSELPAVNPPQAEIAVAVVDHQRLRRGRGNFDNGSHTGN